MHSQASYWFSIGSKQMVCTVATCYWFLTLLWFYKTRSFLSLEHYDRVPQCPKFFPFILKVVTSEKIGGSRVISTLSTWYGGVVMGVLLLFNEAAILYRHFNCAPLQKQNIIVFAANNSRCCECHVAATIIL
jgi:hypothetical protein